MCNIRSETTTSTTRIAIKKLFIMHLSETLRQRRAQCIRFRCIQSIEKCAQTHSQWVFLFAVIENGLLERFPACVGSSPAKGIWLWFRGRFQNFHHIKMLDICLLTLSCANFENSIWVHNTFGGALMRF